MVLYELVKIKEGDILIGKSHRKEKPIRHRKKNYYVQFLVIKPEMLKDASYKAPPSTEGIVSD